MAYDRVVGEVQVVGSGAIEVDPTLRHITVTSVDGHGERGRAVCGNRDAGRDCDPAITSTQSPRIVTAVDSAPERIRGELRRRDAERLAATGGIVQCHSKRSRMAHGNLAEARRNG